jgi:hypothetical protein
MELPVAGRCREAGRRAVLVLRAVASHARRSVFFAISGIFIALGLLLVALPMISAYVLAALCAWIALGAAREAFRRRTASPRRRSSLMNQRLGRRCFAVKL